MKFQTMILWPVVTAGERGVTAKICGSNLIALEIKRNMLKWIK